MTRKMKFKRRLVSALFALTVPLSQGAWAANLHAIIVADTKDANIGASQDLAAIRTLTTSIRQATCLEGKDIIISGDSVSPGGTGKKEVEAAINGLSVGSDDVVLFYYSGHGAGHRGGDPWPDLAVHGQSGGNLLPFSQVKGVLQSKNPRLLIALADACNSFPRGVGGAGRGRKGGGQPAGFKRLFLGYKGTITASGSVPGQYSFGDPTTGGVFTQKFLGGLYQALDSSNPDWNAIMTEVEKDIPVNHPDQQTQTPNIDPEVTFVGTKNVSNEQSCPAGSQIPGDAITAGSGSPYKPNPDKPSLSGNPGKESDFPQCGKGLKRDSATNEKCCLSSGEKTCFKY